MAGNSKDSKILAYKDMINQLNKTISTQTELIQSLQKTLEADRLEKENLRQQIEYLTKKLFGTSSEKRKDIAGQLNLFDEAEQEADPTWEQELPDDITVPEHKRKARRTHADLFKNVPSCKEYQLAPLPNDEYILYMSMLILNYLKMSGINIENEEYGISDNLCVSVEFDTPRKSNLKLNL